MQTGNQYKQRDEKLVSEFYQLYNIRRMTLNDTLAKLSNQFRLGSSYIYQRVFDVKENADFYNQLSTYKTTGNAGSSNHSDSSSKTFEQLQDECPEELSRLLEQEPERFCNLFDNYLIDNEINQNNAKY